MVPLVSAQLARVAIASYKKITNHPVDLSTFGLNPTLFDNKTYYTPSKPFALFLNFVHHQLDDFQIYRFYEHITRVYSVPHYIKSCPHKPKDVYESLLMVRDITKVEAPSAAITVTREHDLVWIYRKKVFKNIADDAPSNISFAIFLKVWIDTLTKRSVKASKLQVLESNTKSVLSHLLQDPKEDFSDSSDITGVAFSVELMDESVAYSEQEFGSAHHDSVSIGLLDSIKITMDYLIGTSDYRIETVADALGVSVRKLQYQLDEHNTTFKQLKDEVLLENTKGLILQKELSLSTIATQLGFASIAQFSRSIKRITGLSPKDYRKQLLELRNLPDV